MSNKRINELNPSNGNLKITDRFPIDRTVLGGFNTQYITGQQIINKLLELLEFTEAIIDVTELPLININSNVFYRTPDEKLFYYFNNDWIEVGSGTYTNLDPIPLAVGGIPANSTFNNLTNQEMWDLLLYPELFGILTAPSSTFVSSEIGLREVGTVLNITFTSTFNRGSINPQYNSASPFRSGLPQQHNYTGTGLIPTNTTDLINQQNLNNYQILLGNQQWQGQVFYSEGVQPKSNKNNDFDIPLPTGNTTFITRSINGVYPVYGTTVNITTQTKQTLITHNSTFIELSLVADVVPNKQTFRIPDNFPNLTGIQQFNTVSNSWEWIGGTKAASLTHLNTNFTLTNITVNVNTNASNIPYKQYVYNGPTIGARQIRLFTN